MQPGNAERRLHHCNTVETPRGGRCQKVILPLEQENAEAFARAPLPGTRSGLARPRRLSDYGALNRQRPRPVFRDRPFSPCRQSHALHLSPSEKNAAGYRRKKEFAMLLLLLIFLCLGAVAGILAGLLGVGGGLVIVPMITYAFAAKGIVGEHTHHLALGTSLATIVFTSVSSFMSHHRNGAVIWRIFAQIAPAIIVGTFLGSKVAAHIPTLWLKSFFVVFLLYVATQMLLNIKPKASREVPGFFGNSVAGGVIGVVSSLVGIGGGSLSVPYMTWCNVPMHKAVGTSAAIGFPIAVSGALGYLLNGAGVPGRPDYTLGFIYLPAFFGIACASVFTAPYGARLAHRLPVPRLKKAFACLLYCMAAQMAWSLIRAM
jgi:uncharacterized membrane protein YfcA